MQQEQRRTTASQATNPTVAGQSPVVDFGSNSDQVQTLQDQASAPADGTTPNAPPVTFTPGALPAVLWGNTCAEVIGPTWNKHGFKADELYAVSVTFEDLVTWGAVGTTSLAGGLRYQGAIDENDPVHKEDRVLGSTPDIDGAGTGSFDLHFSHPGSTAVPLLVSNNGALALMRLAAAAYVLAQKHGMADAIVNREATGWDTRPDLDVRCVLTMGGATEDEDSRNCGYVKGASEDDFLARMYASADQIASHLARAIDVNVSNAGVLGNNALADVPMQVPEMVKRGDPGAQDPENPGRVVTDNTDAIGVSLDLVLDGAWRHRPPTVTTYLTGAPTLQGEFAKSVKTLKADWLLSNKQGADGPSWGAHVGSAEVKRLLDVLGKGLAACADSSSLAKGGIDYESAFVTAITTALTKAFSGTSTAASTAWKNAKEDILQYRPSTVTVTPPDDKGEVRNEVGAVSYPQ